MDIVNMIFEKSGFILWDSTKGGSEPKIIDLDLEIKIIDISK
jgi:hypothetical protein